jgi:hypothetical protein
MNERGVSYEDLNEEQLLSLLEETIGDDSAEAVHERREVLYELNRREIENGERVADVLISVAKEHGWHHPESEITIQVLSSLANSSEEVFRKLLAELGKGEPGPLLHCILEIIRNPDADKKKRNPRF